MGKIKNKQIEKRYRWDQAHLKAAEAYASLSHDPDRKVGCVICKDDVVIACGWNGTPAGEPNDCKDARGKTLSSVIHAEVNALKNCIPSPSGSTVYCTLAPCYQCALAIVMHSVARVVYKETHKCTKGLEYLESIGVEVECVNERC